MEGSNPILSSLKRRRADLPTQRRKDYICERERYPTRTRRPRDRASDTTRADSNARRFPSRDFKLVSMVSSPGLVRPGRRARARDFISPHSPAGAQSWKRKYYPQRDDKECNQSKKNEKKASRHRSRTGTATLFVCVFLLTDATETHLFVIWAIADMFLMFVCFILSAEYEVLRG